MSSLEVHRLTGADDTVTTPSDSWRLAAFDVGQGRAFIRRAPGLYLSITFEGEPATSCTWTRWR